MAEEQGLVCPDGMDRQLYKTIRKDYDRAVSRLSMAVNREAKPQTIQKNQKLRDEALTALKLHLQAFKMNPELRAALNTCNATAAQALALLQQFVTVQTSNHTQVMQQLQILVNHAGSSSSSAAPLAAVVDNVAVEAAVADNVAVEAAEMEVDLPDCIMCYDSCSNGVRMPCCTREGSEKHACKTCFLTLLAQRHQMVCPMCRTELDDLAGFPDVLPKLQACMPKGVLSVLQSGGFVVPLFDFTKAFMDHEDDDGEDVVEVPWQSQFHCKIQCHKTNLSSNPAWVEVKHDSPMPTTTLMPVHMLSVAGDEIHQFVQDKCKGKWPERGSRVRVTCGNPYPMYYQFRGFQRVYGEETSCRFYAPSDDDDHECVDVPLSKISTFKDVFAWTVASISRPFKFVDGQLRKVLLKLPFLPFAQFYIKDILDDGVGPLLELGSVQHAFFQKTVYLAMLETVTLATFVSLEHDPVKVWFCPHPKLPVPSIVKPTFLVNVHIRFRVEFEHREVHFFGYSQGYGNRINAIFTKDSTVIVVETKDIFCLDFRQEW